MKSLSSWAMKSTKRRIAMEKGKRLALHWQILAGMVLGLAAGLFVNAASIDGGEAGAFIGRLNGFIGDLFIRGLRFVAAPIVLFSLIVGAGGLDDVKKLGRMGARTFLLYLATTAVAISLGLAMLSSSAVTTAMTF